MSELFKISAQGISPDLSSFNGSYDEVNLGEKTSGEIFNLLLQLKKIPIPQTDGDFCYPNLIIQSGQNLLLTLTPGDGKLMDNDTGTDMSLEAIEKVLVTGERFDKRERLQQKMKEIGERTALKPEILPTDRDKVKKNNIDTGPASPQISLKVWKSSGWKDFTYYFPIVTAIFCFLIGHLVLGEGREGDVEMVPYFFIAGAALLPLILPLRKLGRHEFRMGVDWKTNTLWCWRANKGVTGFEPDANRIRGFGAVDSTTKKFNHRWLTDKSQAMYRIDKSFTVVMQKMKTDNYLPVNGSKLATAKEAAEIIEMMNKLWESQKSE